MPFADPQNDPQSAAQTAPESNTQSSPDTSQADPQTEPAQPSTSPTPAPQPQPGFQQQPAQTPDVVTGRANGPTPSASPNAAHPAVQKASLLYDVAKALGGGPRFAYAIDPTTGQTTRTEVPVSGRQLGMAIALEALSGGITGAAQHGPNHVEAAAEAGLKQGQQNGTQVQQQNDEAQEQANKDYVRGAAIANTNFLTHQNALRLGQLEYDQHKQFVADAAPVLDNLNTVSAIKASGVAEGDLVPKFHVTKDMAVVDGIVPRLNADGSQATNKDGSLAWDNTYSVIDPNAKISIPPETAQLLASYKIPGYYRTVDGKPQPIEIPESSKIAARMVVNGIASASAIKITDASINSQLAALPNGDADSAKFEVNLRDSLANGDVTPKALQTFARYTSLPLGQALDQMGKDKVDPNIIGQIASLIPADAREQIKQQQLDLAARQKAQAAKANLVVSKSNYEEVLANPTAYSPEQVSAASAMSKTVKNEAAGIAGAEAGARSAAESSGTKDEDQQIAQAIMSGDQPPDMTRLYAHAAGVRAALARQGYNLTQAASDWTATQKRLATLNSQQQVRLQQAVQFSNDSLDLLQQKYNEWVQQAGSSGFKKINPATLAAMKQLPGPAGSAAHVLESQIADLTSELGTVYKGGNASTDESLKLAAKNLDSSWNQETFENALKTIRQNLQIRRNSINNSITPVGVGANSPYARGGAANNSPSPNTPPSRVVPPGATPGRDPKTGAIIGYKTATGQVVRFE